MDAEKRLIELRAAINERLRQLEIGLAKARDEGDERTEESFKGYGMALQWVKTELDVVEVCPLCRSEEIAKTNHKMCIPCGHIWD